MNLFLFKTAPDRMSGAYNKTTRRASSRFPNGISCHIISSQKSLGRNLINPSHNRWFALEIPSRVIPPMPSPRKRNSLPEPHDARLIESIALL